MAPYEHISVLVSFIVSLGVAHILVGLAGLIQSPPRVRVSIPHALWVGIALSTLLSLWLELWDLRTVTRWSLGWIMLLLAGGTLSYLVCALVMPPSFILETVEDLQGFHDQHSRGYIGAFMGFLAWDALTAVVFDPELQNLESVTLVGGFALLLLAPPAAALRWRGRFIQIGVPALMLSLTIAYWIFVFPVFE